MGLIVGMDAGVFLAWIGTILATILCLLYGLYDFLKKKPAKDKPVNQKKKSKKKTEEGE